MQHPFFPIFLLYLTFFQLIVTFNLDFSNHNLNADPTNPLSFSDLGDFSEITEAFQEFYQEEYPNIYQPPTSQEKPPSKDEDINIDDIDPYGFWDD